MPKAQGKDMLKTLALLLPALIPSWRFFDTITLPPRIEYSLLKTTGELSNRWQEFRPRPSHLSIPNILRI